MNPEYQTPHPDPPLKQYFIEKYKNFINSAD